MTLAIKMPVYTFCEVWEEKISKYKAITSEVFLVFDQGVSYWGLLYR